MIDRRAVVLGGVALSGLGAGEARAVPSDRSRAIDALDLPAGFAGIIALGRGGLVQHLRCAGLADLERRRPVTPATQFKWGSASKWVTAVAVLRLVEQGRVSLDTPIGSVLPQLRAETGSSVRLRNLLSNTSGIPDLLGRQLKQEPALRFSDADPADIAARFAGGDLRFAPGAGWDYAALNWVIVAALVQRLTGEPLADLVRRLVFAPLDMRETGFDQADRPRLRHLAAAYAAESPHDRKMLPVPPFLAASGNVAGTAADAIRAAHGIFHGPLLGEEARRALTQVAWPAEEYALGGRIHSIGDQRWAWETGKVEGYRALIAHCLARSETIVVFNSTDLPQSILTGWVEGIACL